ncbi:hypothetical protein [Demequina subtropica]|uniref:hypothetical protein n=1 Tax=Demequina subtropica TaxID=1638989 RepID=UPI0012E039E6|nr:hypothetical protein [Demequina subtropica]
MPTMRVFRLSRARRRLLREHAEAGVTDILFVGSMRLAGVAAWFCTATDDERDKLASHLPELERRFREVLGEVGFPETQVAECGATVESQETVDRDWGSNWRKAMQ